jgi:hypothetical protein
MRGAASFTFSSCSVIALTSEIVPLSEYSLEYTTVMDHDGCLVAFR